MPMIYPPPLRPGDWVAVTATSGPVDPNRLQAGLNMLEAMGLRVHMGTDMLTNMLTGPLSQAGQYLAGDDAWRAAHLQEAFLDPKIKGIFTARGGYGAARLLPLLDFNAIRKHPKVFVGFSDVTALHIAINQQAGLATFHGPMVASCLGHPQVQAATIQSLWHMVTQGPPFHFAHVLAGAQGLYPGRARGRLTGGNLSVVVASLGTPWEINTHRRILFLEEVNEPPYKIDRMLLQLKQAGKLRQAAGFLLGDFSPESLSTLKGPLADHIFSQKKPTMGGLHWGHTSPHMTLPFGHFISICV